jgi:hypothetical protein
MNHDMYLLHWYLEAKTNIFMMGTFLNDYLFISTTATGAGNFEWIKCDEFTRIHLKFTIF